MGFYFILASKDYSRVSSSTTSFPSQRCAFQNVESTICTRDAVPQAEVCVCVRRALKLTSKVHFELQTRQIHTKHVKTAGLEIIPLNTVYVLK